MLVLVQHELLLFAAVFFLIGAVDDLAVDFAWIWLKISGKFPTQTIERSEWGARDLNDKAAVMIPTWQEDAVIADTVQHALKVWPQSDLVLYVGCYRNDPDTIAAVMRSACGDSRLRIVIHDRDGPSTKADCLNRLYLALCDDEARTGKPYHMIVFHDAEDMVDPAALPLLADAIGDANTGASFVQLPVLALTQRSSRWLGSHYCEEFAEAHGKAMVVRDALGAAVPSAGVGCAVARDALEILRAMRSDGLPFAADSLTEDYELGLSIAEAGGTCRFLRARGDDGNLVATRAYFPARLDQIVRQKTRWIHGISLQGWDRVGWSGGLMETWMRIRDRRGPFTALVLLIGYTLLALAAITSGAAAFGAVQPVELPYPVTILLYLNIGAFAWRILWRFAFTTREYGAIEGVRAVLRIPLANVIAIMAGRRAVMAYIGSLRGRGVTWDKTQHSNHPAGFETKAAGGL